MTATQSAIDPVVEQMRRELVGMTGPEADALFQELKQAIVRKLDGDPHAGSHAAAFGAAVRLVLSLIRDIGAGEGQQARLKALAIGMIRAEWELDRASNS